MTSQPERLRDPNTSVAENHQISWLKVDLFEELIKNQIKQFKKIKEFKASPALNAGENYASNVWRVEIEIQLQTDEIKKLSYILKTPKEDLRFDEIHGKHNPFIVELGMTQNILTAFEKLYENVGTEIKFSASAYKLNSPYVHILFDDLRPKGFKVADRFTGFDKNQTKFVLQKLAQMHAASAKYVEINGQYAKMYKYGFFTEEGKPFVAEIKKAMGKSFLKYAEGYKNNEAYIESLRHLQSRFIDEFYKTIEIDPEEFNVLNHGDCWITNIMFQYDDFDQVKEVYLVDFQLPKYGSPAQDLLYFLMSSPKLELKLKKFHYCISYYHEHLISSLKLLKYVGKVPTLRDLHCALYIHGLWGYEAATGALAAVLVKPTKETDFQDFYSKTKEGENFRELLYSNERYIRHMDQILPWLLHRGALECTNN